MDERSWRESVYREVDSVGGVDRIGNMGKVIIAIEEVQQLQDRRREINRPLLKDITWTKNGKPLKFPKEVIQEFEFTGLNNIDFIDGELYKSFVGKHLQIMRYKHKE